MHPRTRTTIRLRQAVLVVITAVIIAGATAGTGVAAEPRSQTRPQPEARSQSQSASSPASLKAVFDAAWSRQPESRAFPARRDAVQAQRRAAAAWTPEPPALEVGNRTDRLTRNDGARELEVGIALPLWLPGERRNSSALADAQASAVESRVTAARLRLAATVREAWWNWQRTRIDSEMAREQWGNARRVAADVARRARAGDLARADQHQADGAVAAAEAAVAQAEAAATAALQALKALTGGIAVTTSAGEPPVDARPPPVDAHPPSVEPEPSPADTPVHPALVELQDRAAVAARAAALTATQSRTNPELILAATREREAIGERYVQTVTLGVRIPLGAGPRHDSRLATARADAMEAEAQLTLDRDRLQSERDGAIARVEAARAHLAAAERRATLARETRGFFDKSFHLGQTDLPTRLRIENEAAEAERQAARSRVELAAAVSAWRQALGLLPE